MKNQLRNLFSPILNIFESGNEPYSMNKSHRMILLVLGSIFMFMTVIMVVLIFVYDLAGALIPGAVFLAVGSTALIVGALGNDRAVAKIWGNK